MKRICRYLQGTKNNVLVFNTSKKLVMDCYADADFTGLQGNEDPQDPICDSIRNGFVVTFANFSLLWVSKLQTEIYLLTIHYEYLELSHSIRALIPLGIIIKEVIENLGVDSEKNEFFVKLHCR